MFTTKNHAKNNIINPIHAHINHPNHHDLVLPKTEESRTNIIYTSNQPKYIKSIQSHHDKKSEIFWSSAYVSF
jgi:hypothetical protein